MRDEVHRLPGPPVRVLEPAQVQADPGEVAVEEPAGPQLPVVVGLRVDPGLALHDHRPAGEPRALAVDHADHDQQERPVEEQAPDLAERALLGGERRAAVVVPGHPEHPPPQHPARALDRARRIRRHHALLVQPERVDLARLHRLLPERPHQRAGPREQARDERDEQQRRDQDEPPRPVHVEQSRPAVQRSHQRVVQLVPHHPLRRVGPLRDQRTDHRRERQHQQQDQRRAHRAQRSPHQGRGPPQGDAAGGGHGGSRGFYGRPSNRAGPAVGPVTVRARTG